MLTKRIIPCLDVKDGRTVKGVNFVQLRDAGDAVELASRYAEEGADELVLLDITATDEKRKTLADLVRKVAAAINIPFTVGGGISGIDDVRMILENGADKVSVNSAAVRDHKLIDALAREFGSQCVVVAVDTRRTTQGNRVYLNGGKIATELETIDWIKETEQRGAGEILLTSMDHDGTRNGFDVEFLKEVSSSIRIPVIASGGAGNMDHFADAFLLGGVDAALAASIFHFGEIKIRALKEYLYKQGIQIRL
jgi:cyclase